VHRWAFVADGGAGSPPSVVGKRTGGEEREMDTVERAARKNP
jgi:hypothetical protein